MAWITTKDGRRVNTEWFDEDERRKYAQIEANQEQAILLNKQMNIPYDQWKAEADEDIQDFENGRTSHTSDENIYIMGKDIRKVTKADTLRDVENWKMDDGTYGTGDGDEAINIFYDNGSILELTDGEPHKRWSKQGIKGISISTADYEQVWGESYNRGKKEWEPITTHEMNEDLNDIPGYSNSYSGYKTTGTYKVRRKVEQVFNPKKNKWESKLKVIKMSTVRKY